MESGQAELAPKTAAVKDSIAALQDALGKLKENPTAADLAMVKPALHAVQTSLDDLITDLESAC